jgi:hypothetical protein
MDPQQGTPANGNFEQVVERLKTANNVLVTVSTNPSVDQLAACIGLTLSLNKLGKHASAVFSGKTPSMIEFLKPEKTLEKNTDSLRDFIIALDKAKADKLRYKVEDEVVKIFITPYKTSITDKDLDFSQGDFNIDAVVALGVHDKAHLDAAILAHGRILHDAAVLALNTSGGVSRLGSVNWSENDSSSLCEMVSDVIRELSPNVFDEQISTALLTGIVAETDRFSNQKALPHTMSIAGVLMAAGASAQLVTAKLEEAKKLSDKPPKKVSRDDKNDDYDQNSNGTLQIDHDKDPEKPLDPPEEKLPEPKGVVFDEPEFVPPPVPAPEPAQPQNSPLNPAPKPSSDETSTGRVMYDPPQLGGQLTANSVPEYKQYSDTTDPFTQGEDKDSPILNRQKDSIQDDNNDKTLKEIEEAVDSPHLHQSENAVPPPPPVDNARQVVDQAAEESQELPAPIEALGAQKLGVEDLHEDNANQTSPDKDFNSNGAPPSSPPPPVPPPMLPPT